MHIGVVVCGTRDLYRIMDLVVVQWLSSCAAWAPEHELSSWECADCGMWDL